MKMISWNVNGLRACVTKGFTDYFNDVDADVFSIQETKLQEGQIDFAPEGYYAYWNYAEKKGYSGVAVFTKKDVDADVFSIQETKLQEGQIDFAPEGYYAYWNYAEKKGYSGVAVFTKKKPISVSYGIGIDKHDHEGRVITLEFEDFYHVTCYTPNSQSENARLAYRMNWEDDFRDYINELDAVKPVILTGDLNVAHEEIDLKNPSTNRKNAGFTDEEREKMTELLSSGYIDTFRYFYPDKTGAYSWWSYRFKAREKNAGWRIDYFIVSQRLKDKLISAKIHGDVMGSDHCPVELDINL